MHDVASHLVDPALTTRLGFLVGHGGPPRPRPLDSRRVEEVVHGEDVPRPLGLSRAYPTEAVDRALRLLGRTPASLGGARELVAGVRLRATDADVSLGEGPDVNGPALSLLLAVSGRLVAGDLACPGLPALAATPDAARVGSDRGRPSPEPGLIPHEGGPARGSGAGDLGARGAGAVQGELVHATDQGDPGLGGTGLAGPDPQLDLAGLDDARHGPVAERQP